MQSQYYHSLVGFNSRLDELQAAILRVKLPYLKGWSDARRQNAMHYGDGFQAAGLLPFVTPPAMLPNRTHIFHQYVIRCKMRDELQAALKAAGIGTAIYYPVSLHEQECFRHLGYSPDNLPRSRSASLEVLALPVYPELSDEQRSHVVNAIASFFRNNS
jgi:dTDP-4-amino-4,6-dideoxygalactose transaminase